MGISTELPVAAPIIQAHCSRSRRLGSLRRYTRSAHRQATVATRAARLSRRRTAIYTAPLKVSLTPAPTPGAQAPYSESARRGCSLRFTRLIPPPLDSLLIPALF